MALKPNQKVLSSRNNPKWKNVDMSMIDDMEAAEELTKDFPASLELSGEHLHRVTAYLTANKIKNEEFYSVMKSLKALNNFHEVKHYDEVIYSRYYSSSENKFEGNEFEQAVASNAQVGEVYIFDYGAIVIWGLDEKTEKSILRELQPFEIERLSIDDIEIENFKFCHFSDRAPRLFHDIIYLRTGNQMVKMTISHVLSQSLKVSLYETLIENIITHTRNIPYELAASGNISIPRTIINKKLGEVFIMKMNVNLISNVLDTPEIFWLYPSLNPLYKAVREYLEISERVELLNQRFTVISDMLGMLRDHKNTMHAERLEIFIVILILFEVILEIWKHK